MQMGWLNNINLVERFTFLTMNISRKWGTQKLCGCASRHHLKKKIRLIMHRIPPNHLIDLHILRKKSPYSELFWSAFSPHFPAFGLTTERLSLRIQENARKVRTRITSNTDTFYAVYVSRKDFKIWCSKESQQIFLPAKASERRDLAYCRFYIVRIN